MNVILWFLDLFYIFLSDVYDIWFYTFTGENLAWEKARYSLLQTYAFYKDRVAWLIQYLIFAISAWFADEYSTYIIAFSIIFITIPTYVFITLPLFLLTSIKDALMYLLNAIIDQALSDWFYLNFFLDVTVFRFFRDYFSVCPYYYQAIFYSLVIYTLRLILYSNVANEKNIYVNSSLQWVYLTIKYAINRIGKYSYIYEYISSAVMGIYLHLKYSLFWMQRIYARVFISEVKAENKQHLWRPVFKRISYFGYFSSLRTKWFKNRKR